MDADERLTALKKAYAEIILNMAKEAAARIMASERKALRLEQELNAAKEQALQLLLRLKKMMDCKVVETEMTYLSQKREILQLNGQVRVAEDTIREAEATSLNQLKKNEELEAQLNEAEDIVEDLREELKEAHVELERVRNNKLEYNGVRDAVNKDLHENRLNTSQPLISSRASQLVSFTTLETKNSASTEVHIGYLHVGTTPDLLPPISEKNRLNTSQPIISSPLDAQHEFLSSPAKKSSTMKSPTSNQKNDFCVGHSNDRKPDIPSIMLKNKGPEFCGNRRTQRIRAFEEKLMAGELSFSDRTDDDVNYQRSTKEEGEGEAGNSLCMENKTVVGQADSNGYRVKKVKSLRRIRSKCARFRKNKFSSLRDLSNGVRKIDETSVFSCLEAHDAQFGEDPSNSVPRLSADTEDNTLLGLKKVNASDGEFFKNDSVRNPTGKDLAPMENFTLPVCRMDVEKVDLPAVKTETKMSGAANGIPNQPVTERVFKYTFQRKRKRESLNSSDGGPPQKGIVEKCTAERQNGSVEKEKSSSINESSRDSRRLAQVARQLVSLSVRKWWQ